MTEISFEDLAAGLRGWARGGTAHEQAAVELLLWHETWLRRRDFKGACITQRAAGLVAIINWEEAREFIDRGCTQRGQPGLPASSSQRRLLDFAVALGENMFGLSSMGGVHRWHMAAAFARACGYRLEGPVPEAGHNHPDFIPGDPETCGACAREAKDEGRTLPDGAHCPETSDGRHCGQWHEGGRCGACGLTGPESADPDQPTNRDIEPEPEGWHDDPGPADYDPGPEADGRGQS